MMPFPLAALLDCEIGAIRTIGQYEHYKANATGHFIVADGNNCLVTAAHALDGLDSIGVRVNLSEGMSRVAKVFVNQFAIDKALDAAAVRILSTRSFPMGVVHANDFLSTTEMKELRLVEGTQMFVVGHPLLPTLTDDKQYRVGSDLPPVHATVKHGFIARIADWYANQAGTIVIDCDIFPGNSGSAVMTRQQIFHKRPYYLGMVTDFIPYVDEGAGREAKVPRFPFKQNSGYAHVAPANAIKELLARSGPDSCVWLDFWEK